MKEPETYILINKVVSMTCYSYGSLRLLKPFVAAQREEQEDSE